ncbi:hypothetical protein CJB45_004242 [Salmonella enterica]|nr:hypothetical protein [Salmonella enterica]
MLLRSAPKYACALAKPSTWISDELSTTGKKWVFRNLGGRKLMKLFS